MKKAKEYYSEIKPILEGDNIQEKDQVAVNLLKSLLNEVDEIRVMRKARTDSAMLAIIEEQNLKFNSIKNKLDKDGIVYLKENGFKNYMYEKLDIKGDIK